MRKKSYCACRFAMIRRNQKTQKAYCFECKKQIKEYERRNKKRFDR